MFEQLATTVADSTQASIAQLMTQQQEVREADISSVVQSCGNYLAMCLHVALSLVQHDRHTALPPMLSRDNGTSTCSRMVCTAVSKLYD